MMNLHAIANIVEVMTKCPRSSSDSMFGSVLELRTTGKSLEKWGYTDERIEHICCRLFQIIFVKNEAKNWEVEMKTFDH